MSRSLSHEVGILTVGRIASYAVMFFVPLVNVRTLTVEEYGYYRQFWLIFETVTPIVILGFPRSLLYYLPRSSERSEKSTYITQTVLFLALSAAVAIILYAVIAQVLGQGLGEAARSFYWRLSFFTLCMVLTDYMEVLFVAQRQPVAQSVYHASIWGLQSAVVIAASFLTHDVNTIIWALAVFGLARLCFAIVYTHKRYGFSLEFVSLRSAREQASFAIPLGLAGIALLLVTQTDKFIINRFMGRDAFAIYSVGAFQVPLANIVRASVGNVTFPLLVQYQKAGNHAAMLDLWRRSLLKTVVVFFPAFVFLEITARPFIVILFTEQYADATPVFMVYMLLFLRSSIETGAIIQSFNRTVFLFLSLLLGFVANVGLGIVLYHSLGRLGVPLATLIAISAVAGVQLWYSARLIGASFLDLFPAGELGKRFVVAAIPGAVLLAVYQKHPVTTLAELAAAAMIYGILYAALCAWTRLVTIDDLKSLIGRKPL